MVGGVLAELAWMHRKGRKGSPAPACAGLGGVLDAAAVDRASWLALYGFGYGFLPLLGGIIVFAAGVKNAVIQDGEPLTASTAWFLAAGVATYLVRLAWFRPLLGIGPTGARLAMAAAVLPYERQPTLCEALPQGDRRDLHPG